MQLAPLDAVKMVFRKYDGSLHWHQQCAYLGADRYGSWIGAPKGNPIRRGAEAPIEMGQAHVLLIRPDVWWTACFNAEPAPIEVYCDVTSVVRWLDNAGGPYLTAVDLDLDVARTRDGRVELLDEDEFAEHRERYAYPADVVAAAEASAQWLIEACGGDTEPFASEYRTWLDRVPAAPLGEIGTVARHG